MDALVSVIAVALTILLLGTVIRFSVISFFKTRGWRSRLRQPDATAVAGVCGFQPPPDLVDLFRAAPFIERVEFQLVDERQRPARRFDIGAFIPLTARDVREARAVHGVRDGIPIADDGDKGSYVVLSNGTVVLRSPNIPAHEVAVAGSSAELKTFSPRETDA